MKFTRELSDTLTVTAVGPEGIRINGELWPETIAMTADRIISPWPTTPLAELDFEQFERLLQHSPEVVVLGTGASNVFLPRDLMFAFAKQGIGLEAMDTAAAARTFNVLAMEGRRVGALLYPVREP